MTALHLISITFAILYFLECHTSRMYKRMLDEILRGTKDENRR